MHWQIQYKNDAVILWSFHDLSEQWQCGRHPRELITFMFSAVEHDTILRCDFCPGQKLKNEIAIRGKYNESLEK